MKKASALILLLCCATTIFAQDNLIDSIIQKNYYQFTPTDTKTYFKGEGWTILTKEINKANSVLIGETHFTNEVPYFTEAIIEATKFDNYFHEISPSTDAIIAANIKALSAKNLDAFVKEYNSNFSFLRHEKDFDLYKKMVQSGINTFGVEQVSLFSDRLIISRLMEKTNNKKAKEIYAAMLKKSLEQDKEDQKYYLFSTDFLEKTAELSKLPLSKDEKKQIEDLQLSREIYLNRNHHLRIQLMKNILIQDMPHWTNKKNLFKFGANHTPKGESLMEIFDIGNLVSTIEDGNFRTSLHIMIIGKSEDETIEDLKTYKAFMNVIKSDDWYTFDLRPLQKAISKGKLKIENITLLRIIKGNDFLVYVPNFTESKKMNSNSN